MEESKKANLLNYLQNLLGQARHRLYIKDKEGKLYPKRPIYFRLQKYCRAFLNNTPSAVRWVIIPGLRGVGKTTVLAQIYFELLHKYDNKEIELLYVSLDEPIALFRAGLGELVLSYEELKGKSLEKMGKPIVMIIDEVHTDPKWTQVLKTIYDRARNVLILCSGSSAIHLQQTPDVARRAKSEKLYPLNFYEYQLIRHGIKPIPDLKQTIHNTLYSSFTPKQIFKDLKSLQPKVNSYWSKVDRKDIYHFISTGTLPFTAKINDDALVHEQINGLIDKIIQKDIHETQRFDAQTIGMVKRILLILADSEDIGINKLANAIDIDYRVTASILDILEKAELLIRVQPHGSGFGKVRKPSKYLFMSPAIRSSLFDIAGIRATQETRRGKLLEDVVAGYFYREFVAPGQGSLSYDSSKGGADFVLQIGNRLQIAVEVSIGEKGIKQLLNTMHKIKCNYGIVFSNDPLAYHDNILKVPLDYFFLL